MKNYFYLFLLSVGFIACTSPEKYPIEPELIKARFSRNLVKQYPDSFKLYLDFTDGNGDLGSNDQNQPLSDILIIDTRRIPADTSFYSIPYFDYPATENGVSGEIEVSLPAPCCIDPSGIILCPLLPGQQQGLSYTIQIRDRAGNWSNALVTDSLFFKCEL